MDYISIIIPAYNSERWIERCLDSVVYAYDIECEIIIVDDGSTDRTSEIACRYADKDPRITTITIEHSGPCAARKAGFLESQGDYVMFVDSDDVVAPNSIRELRRLSLRPPKALIDDDIAHNPDCRRQCDDRPMVVVTNTVERIDKTDRPMLSGERRALTGNEFALELLNGTMPGFLPGNLFSRAILEAIEWDNDPSITHHDFAMLLLSMAMKLRDMANEGLATPRLVLIDPTFMGYNYLRRPGSQSVMMSLTHEGLNRVWRQLCAIDLPEPEFTLWGLDLIRKSFIERGIPFENNLYMARNLLNRTQLLNNDLPERYEEIVRSLSSSSKRRRIARRLSREGGLTTIAPHISFVIVCHRDYTKVARTVKSIFKTGLRNLEVILVDYNNDHSTSVGLNRLNIMYPRMRVVKADPQKSLFYAMRAGVAASGGLSLSFIRPGDHIGGYGIYDAVRSIDYGADLVLTNSRRRNRFIGLKDAPTSFAYLNALSETPYDIYTTLAEHLRNDLMGKEFLGYGLVWRRDVLIDTGIEADKFDGFASPTLTRRIILRLLEKRIRVIAQDRYTPAAYIYTVNSLLRYAHTGRLASSV